MRKMRIDWLFVVLALFTPGAHAQATYKVLYNFGSNAGDPTTPQWLDVVAQGRDGNLYSTAPGGAILQGFG